MNRVKPLRFDANSKHEEIKEERAKPIFSEEVIKHTRYRSKFYSFLTFLFFLSMAILFSSIYDGYLTFKEIFEFNETFGYLYLSFISITALFIIKFILNQRKSIKELKRVSSLQLRGFEVIKNPSKKSIKYLRVIMREYEKRIETKEGVQKLQDKINDSILDDEIIDNINEYILKPLDKRVDDIILKNAKHNAILTAISPVAIIDVAILVVKNYKMAIDISKIYGFRPSFIGNMIIFKRVLENLIFASVSELASDTITESIGQSALSKISYSASQGLANGIFTIRVGLSAKELSRPTPVESKNAFKSIFSILFEAFSKKSF